MSKTAILRLPELTLGLIPGAGATQRLGRLIGWSRAKEAILLGDNINADKALAWGIVNFVAEPKEMDKVVGEVITKLSAGGPIAQRAAKGLLYYGAQADQRTGLYLEAAISADLGATKDLNEGLTAMNNRRTPKFTGK
jgi:enoyl-CoA hydratase/carnithine racemase